MRLTVFDRAQLTPGAEMPRVDVTGEITKQMRMPRDPSPVVRRARRKALPDTGPQKVARRALRKMGGCRESLARELGANRCTLNRWLRGVANPKASTLKALKELADGPPRKNRKAMIADLVAAALAACGTQKALAKAVGCADSTVEKWLSGRHLPQQSRIDQLEELAGRGCYEADSARRSGDE